MMLGPDIRTQMLAFDTASTRKEGRKGLTRDRVGALGYPEFISSDEITESFVAGY